MSSKRKKKSKKKKSKKSSSSSFSSAANAAVAAMMQGDSPQQGEASASSSASPVLPPPPQQVPMHQGGHTHGHGGHGGHGGHAHGGGHTHTHGGKPCTGHGPPVPEHIMRMRRKLFLQWQEQQRQQMAAQGGGHGGHTHTHGGKPCTGHGPPPGGHAHGGHGDHGGHSHAHGGGHSHAHPGAGPSTTAPEGEAGLTPDEEEAAHLVDIQLSFQMYGSREFERLGRMQEMWTRVPESTRDLLPDPVERFRKIRSAILENYKFTRQVSQCAQEFMSDNPGALSYEQLRAVRRPTPTHFSKVRTTLRQCVRDWSEAGAAERAESYGLIMAEMLRLYPEVETRNATKVLVPGSGLGRLPWELANAGFAAQGNEFSYQMLFASFELMNRGGPNRWQLFPWAHDHVNVAKLDDMLASVQVPDVDPTEFEVPGGEVSMVAGEFTECYPDPEQFDCIVTCYFLDTAHDVVAYMQHIHKLLKPGGHWINLGPLLYHYADMPGELSIELTQEEVLSIIPRIGFETVSEQLSVPSVYTSNPNSMMHMHYKCIFATYKKAAEPGAEE